MSWAGIQRHGDEILNRSRPDSPQDGRPPAFLVGRGTSRVATKAGEYFNLKSARARWRHVKGEPEGVDEVVLHSHKDGSYTHVLSVEKGVEFTQTVRHDFYEEAYYLDGEMLNTKTGKKIGGGVRVPPARRRAWTLQVPEDVPDPRVQVLQVARVSFAYPAGCWKSF